MRTREELSEASRRDADRARAVLQVAALVNATLDLDTVLRTALESARACLEADLAILDFRQTYGEAGGSNAWPGAYFAGFEEGSCPIKAKPTFSGLNGEVFRTQKTLRLANRGEHPRSVRLPKGHPPIGPVLGAPLFVDGECIGAALLARAPSRPPFEEADETALVTIANITSAAVKNAQLYELCRSSHVGEMEALVRLSSTLLATFSCPEILDAAVEAASATLGTDFACVLLVDASGEELVLRAVKGWPKEWVGEKRLRPEGNILSVGAFQRKGALSATVGRGDWTLAPFFVEQGAQSCLVAPMMTGDKNIGLLGVHTRQPREFTEEEGRFLSVLAGSAAVAYERGELFNQVARSEKSYRLLTESMDDTCVVVQEGRIVFANRGACQMSGYSLEELVEQPYSRFVPPEVAPELVEIEKKLMSGQPTPRRGETRVVTKDGRKVPVEVSVTPMEYDGRFALLTLARDITERKQAEKEERRLREDLEARQGELLESYRTLIASLVYALEARHSYTRSHSDRVRHYSREIGRKLGLSPEEMQTLDYAAELHDLGKIGIRDAILLKPGKLTPPEWADMRLHSEKSVDLVRHADFVKKALPMIRSHHERYDGAGYPDGLYGEAIPLGGRIIAVADAYDALTSERPYRAAFDHERAAEILQNGAGTQWDPEVVQAFLEALAGGGNAGGETATDTAPEPR